LAFDSLAPEPIAEIAISILASQTKSSFRSLARMPPGGKRFLFNKCSRNYQFKSDYDSSIEIVATHITGLLTVYLPTAERQTTTRRLQVKPPHLGHTRLPPQLNLDDRGMPRHCGVRRCRACRSAGQRRRSGKVGKKLTLAGYAKIPFDAALAGGACDH
jgi:hypothetical protein